MSDVAKLRVAGLLAGLAIAFAAGTAHAADLVKPAPAIQQPDWTGFYIGLQAGGGWGQADQTDAIPFDSGWYDVSGGLVGATWGYNWQVGWLVVSFESDAAASNIRGSTTGDAGLNGPCGGRSCKATLQWFGTDRLRLGYAYGRWLPYVTGGMAWGYIHGEEGDGTGNPSGSDSEFHFGWTVGGGVEAQIDPRWSAKVEYLYADLRDGGTFTDRFVSGFQATESEAMHVHIIRAGLNYRFAPGPGFVSFLPPNPGPVAGPWQWAGLYAGVNIGDGAGVASQSDAIVDHGSYDVSGAIAGGAVGYNWQRDHVVYGAEGDLGYSWIKGSTSGSADAPCSGTGSDANCDTRLRWLGTARVRLGYAWDRLLPYVTGGLAVGSLESSESGSGTVTRVGWTAGAGIEAKINNRWSTKLEYLYVDLGSGEGFTDTFGGNTFSENVTFQTHILRAGVNYLFN
jgi:outer membrane immunogenic protein